MMTNSEVAILIGVIFIGTVILVVTAFVVGMSMRSPLPVRVRVSTICMLVGAAILSIKLGIDIYQGDSWVQSALLVGAALASAALVWFSGKNKTESNPKHES
jgi:protein-S-isoprenylcysteine O-methyltransferase Ste14